MIKVGTSSPKAAARGGKGTKNPKKAKASTTKLSQLEALQRRPEGATIAQLASELDRQPHSVRGAISGSLSDRPQVAALGGKWHTTSVYRLLQRLEKLDRASRSRHRR